MRKPMPWFRFYTEALNDPKVQRLSPHLFKAWINLLCLAGNSDGVLPCVADIAFRLRMSEHDAKSAVDDLILAELLDICPDGYLRPHNWDARQCSSDTSTERTRKYREKKRKDPCDVTSDVTVTSQVTDCDVTVTSQVTDCDAKCDGLEERREEKRRTEKKIDNYNISSASDAARDGCAAPKVDLGRLMDACSGALDNPANCMGLLTSTIPTMWLAQGCDLELDIMPTLTAAAKKYQGKRIRSWDYFTPAIVETRDRRARGLPPPRSTPAPVNGNREPTPIYKLPTRPRERTEDELMAWTMRNAARLGIPV